MTTWRPSRSGTIAVTVPRDAMPGWVNTQFVVALADTEVTR